MRTSAGPQRSASSPGPDALVSGSGRLLGFSYADAAGHHRVDPVFTADCAPHPLTGTVPVVAPLAKSGGWSDADPDAEFVRQFITEPGVRLPAGDWDVGVETEFYDGPGCSGAPHVLQAIVRIHITDPAAAGP